MGVLLPEVLVLEYLKSTVDSDKLIVSSWVVGILVWVLLQSNFLERSPDFLFNEIQGQSHSKVEGGTSTLVRKTAVAGTRGDVWGRWRLRYRSRGCPGIGGLRP